jgi:hypothetical protein
MSYSLDRNIWVVEYEDREVLSQDVAETIERLGQPLNIFDMKTPSKNEAVQKRLKMKETIEIVEDGFIISTYTYAPI